MIRTYLLITFKILLLLGGAGLTLAMIAYSYLVFRDGGLKVAVKNMRQYANFEQSENMQEIILPAQEQDFPFRFFQMQSNQYQPLLFGGNSQTLQNANPLLFVHGNQGSPWQITALNGLIAQVLMSSANISNPQQHAYVVFSIDFRGAASAYSDTLVKREGLFLRKCIAYLAQNMQKAITLVSHSMGGAVIMESLSLITDMQQLKRIKQVIFFNCPLTVHPLPLHPSFAHYYNQFYDRLLSAEVAAAIAGIRFISISSGKFDVQVRAETTYLMLPSSVRIMRFASANMRQVYALATHVQIMSYPPLLLQVAKYLILDSLGKLPRKRDVVLHFEYSAQHEVSLYQNSNDTLLSGLNNVQCQAVFADQTAFLNKAVGNTKTNCLLVYSRTNAQLQSVLSSNLSPENLMLFQIQDSTRMYLNNTQSVTAQQLLHMPLDGENYQSPTQHESLFSLFQDYYRTIYIFDITYQNPVLILYRTNKNSDFTYNMASQLDQVSVNALLLNFQFLNLTLSDNSSDFNIDQVLGVGPISYKPGVLYQISMNSAYAYRALRICSSPSFSLSKNYDIADGLQNFVLIAVTDIMQRQRFDTTYMARSNDCANIELLNVRQKVLQVYVLPRIVGTQMVYDEPSLTISIDFLELLSIISKQYLVTIAALLTVLVTMLLIWQIRQLRILRDQEHTCSHQSVRTEEDDPKEEVEEEEDEKEGIVQLEEDKSISVSQIRNNQSKISRHSNINRENACTTSQKRDGAITSTESSTNLHASGKRRTRVLQSILRYTFENLFKLFFQLFFLFYSHCFLQRAFFRDLFENSVAEPPFFLSLPHTQEQQIPYALLIVMAAICLFALTNFLFQGLLLFSRFVIGSLLKLVKIKSLIINQNSLGLTFSICILYYSISFTNQNKWYYLFLFLILVIALRSVLIQQQQKSLGTQAANTLFYVAFLLYALNIPAVIQTLTANEYSAYLIDAHEYNKEYLAVICWCFLALNIEHVTARHHTSLIVVLYLMATILAFFVTQGAYYANFMLTYSSFVITFLTMKQTLVDACLARMN